MATTRATTNHQAGRPKRPAATWALMGAALAITVLLGVAGSLGFGLSVWLFAMPAVLGLAGALLAARNDSPGWMVASGFWGIALVPGLIMIVTLLGGP